MPIIEQDCTVKVSQKAFLSLLISLMLCAGIAALTYTGLFDLIETHFYNPSITGALIRETGRDAELIQDFFYELQDRFESSLNEPAVRRSFLSSQNSADIFERSKIYGLLQESVPGLYSVRFVDASGTHIHFSTYSPDILSQDHHSIVYRTYNENPANLPFDTVHLPAQEQGKLTLDTDRIIFSFPFYDSLGVYQGTALFTVSVAAVYGQLVSAGRIMAGDDLLINTAPPGIISLPPGFSKTEILARSSVIWNTEGSGFTPFSSADSGTTLALVWVKIRQGILYGRVVYGNMFLLSNTMRILLLAAIFLTIYLILFFFFNLKPDPMTKIKYRLQKLQASLVKQISEDDNTDWAWKLEQRREDVRDELKRTLKTGKSGYSENDIDSLIDESWDGLIAFAGRRKKNTVSDDDRLMQTLLTGDPGLPFNVPPVKAAVKNVNGSVAPKKPEAVRLDKTSRAIHPANSGTNGLLAMASKKQVRSRPGDEKLEELETVKDEVIIEQNGVHYINDDVFRPDTTAKEQMDNDFRILVESVLGKA